MNNYEFKTDGQSVYFRPNDRCEWRLLCVAIDHLSAMQVEKGLQQSTIDFSLTYQFKTDILIHKPLAISSHSDNRGQGIEDWDIYDENGELK